MLEQGRLPNLSGLIKKGVVGRLDSPPPYNLSSMATSIVTGKPPGLHGIVGPAIPSADRSKMQPVTSAHRESAAVWNMFSTRHRRSMAVAWPVSHPAEPILGNIVSNRFAQGLMDRRIPMQPATIHPQPLNEKLAEFRIFADELKAEDLLPLLPLGHEIDQDHDPRVAFCARLMSQTATVSTCSQQLLPEERWSLMAIWFPAMASFNRRFLKFHLADSDIQESNDYRLYQNVLNAAYHYHDLLLGQLIQQTGNDATVILVSPVAESPVVKKRFGESHGMLVISGSDIHQDELIHGANLLDITPTILTACGLPIGKDMKGRPLLDAWQVAPQVDMIDSWDTQAGPNPEQEEISRHPNATSVSAAARPVESDPKQLGQDQNDAQVSRAADLYEYRRTKSLMHSGLYRNAISNLERLAQVEPFQVSATLDLAQCLWRLRNIEQLEPLIDQFVKDRGSNDGEIPAYIILLQGRLKIIQGDEEAGKSLLANAASAANQDHYLLTQIGETYLSLREAEHAAEVFRRVLAEHPHHAAAHLGYGRSLLQQKRPQQAADKFTEAIVLRYHYPVAHFCRAVGQLRLRDPEGALDAASICLKQNPSFAPAHRLMARVYKRFYRDDHLAAQHLRQAKQLREKKLRESDSKWGSHLTAEAAGLGPLDVLASVANRRRQRDPNQR